MNKDIEQALHKERVRIEMTHTAEQIARLADRMGALSSEEMGKSSGVELDDYGAGCVSVSLRRMAHNTKMLAKGYT